MKRITKNTQLCMSLAARPGNFGTLFQNYLYEKLDLDYIYKAFTTTNLGDAIRGIRALGIRGCAISMPFKEDCIPLLDALDHSANTIQSVNTIVNTDGQLKGYNTDYIAIEQLLKENKIDKNLRFALRGNGGMAKAVLAALANNGYKNGVVIVRRPEAGKALATAYGYSYLLESEDFEADLLINATPIGMAGGKEELHLSFTLGQIEKAQVVFDVVALPVETPLLKAAKQASKITISGSDVAVIQSLEQFVLYTGVRPPLGTIVEARDYTHRAISGM